MTSILSELPEMDFIRGDIPSPSSYSSGSINSKCTQTIAGLKIERLFFKEKVGLSAGLNYQYHNTSFGKTNEWNTGDDYFYWQIEDGSINTQYYRVKGVDQNNSYLAIPFEIRYFISQPYNFRLYGKLGLSINLLLHSETDILYLNEEMEMYSDEMIAMLNESKAIHTSMHLAGGILLGRQGHRCVNLELQMPYFFLNQPGGITNPLTGVGFEFSVLFPLNTNVE